MFGHIATPQPSEAYFRQESLTGRACSSPTCLPESAQPPCSGSVGGVEDWDARPDLLVERRLLLSRRCYGCDLVCAARGKVLPGQKGATSRMV